ncbi:hypothetical protein [Geobacillus sp. B4113_201601]|uniref:hypothetical protein n=1 Tax=Geobacillus sp. B4113_201601 TaxID=1586290 RepID=UPI000781C130|nr:hypothetical protein [Geobacillus sp. B4113_201601]KYD24424.1 hypothetical protein B4113_2459 [Geobacillus sp. B4113_201601]
MRAKKALPILLTSAMLFGSAPSSVPIPNLVSKVEAATVSVPYVKPEIIQEQWAVGDYVDSIGNVVKDAAENVGFKTSKSEPGTLVIELRKKEYCCWESIRTSTGTPRALLYAEPYRLDGRDGYATKVTDTLHLAMDYMNRDSKEDFYLRLSFYVENPDSDHTYWLAFLGSNARNSYYYKAYFYPNVNLVPLTSTERDQYIKGQSINIGSNSGNNTGSNTSNKPTTPNTERKPTIPKLNVKYIGRLVIKSNNVFMYNSKGKVHRKLRKNEDVRVYAVQKDRYLVGDGYYVKKSDSVSYYVGTIYSKKGDMIIYTPKGKPYKKIKGKQKLKVYSTKNNVYQVGGGYYVRPRSNIVFQR